MAKLYDLDKDYEIITQESFKGIDFLNDISEKISSELEDANLSFSALIDNIKSLQNQFNLVNKIKERFNDAKKLTKDYISNIGALTPVVESIADNLGVKYKMPSLEDFSNPYSVDDCHQIAMEGFVDIIKKIWEKIKSFFLAFFKKIQLFFKKLLSMDLQLNEYEDAIGDLIAKIKSKEYTLSNNKAIIKSKLPSMLAKDGMEKMDVNYLLGPGLMKIDRLYKFLAYLSTGGVNEEIRASKILNETLNSHNEVFSNHLKNINNEINKKINQNTLANLNNDEINSFIVNDGIRDAALKLLSIIGGYLENIHRIINSTFNNYENVSSLNNLPPDIYEKARESIDISYITNNNINIYALIDYNKTENALPYLFNIYLINISYEVEDNLKYKYLTFTNKQPIETVNDELLPINTKENLIKLYEDYKKKYGKINIKNIEKTLSNVVSVLEKLINKAGNNAVVINNALNNGMETLKRAEITLNNKIKNINKESTDKKDNPNDNLNNINIDDLKKIIKDNLNYLNRVKKAYDNYTNLTIETLNFLTNLEKTMVNDVIAIYLEVKYELIKYIYNNCKLYVKSY